MMMITTTTATITTTMDNDDVDDYDGHDDYNDDDADNDSVIAIAMLLHSAFMHNAFNTGTVCTKYTGVC